MARAYVGYTEAKPWASVGLVLMRGPFHLEASNHNQTGCSPTVFRLANSISQSLFTLIFKN